MNDKNEFLINHLKQVIVCGQCGYQLGAEEGIKGKCVNGNCIFVNEKPVKTKTIFVCPQCEKEVKKTGRGHYKCIRKTIYDVDTDIGLGKAGCNREFKANRDN